MDTAKASEEACTDLKAAVASHGFGLLTVHDLAETLRSKNISFAENRRVFEACNPKQEAKVLELATALSVVLPCRISVYTQAGQTRIGMIRPVEMLRNLSGAAELMGIAQEIATTITAVMWEMIWLSP